MKYEYIIIGAGVCGCSISYFLRDKNCLLIDRDGIAKNASGSAGAFLSPMVGVKSLIKDFINEALLFSLNLYRELNLKSFIQNGLLKLPRDERDFSKFREYEKFINIEYKKLDGGFFFDIGAVVNPNEVAKELTKEIEFRELNVENLEFRDGIWIVNQTLKSENIILATGFEEIIDFQYLKIRPVWGQRIDIATSSKVPFNIHKNISISTNRENGIVSIGATHKKNCSISNIEREESLKLIELAKEMRELKDIELIQEFSGVRAGSIDFLPIVGEVIDAKASLQKYPNIVNGERFPHFELKRYPNLYILNGVGGRGFVLAPYIAKILSEYILEDRAIAEILTSDRLFYKWARKHQSSSK